jgi:hypothetical protein
VRLLVTPAREKRGVVLSLLRRHGDLLSARSTNAKPGDLSTSELRRRKSQNSFSIL